MWVEILLLLLVLGSAALTARVLRRPESGAATFWVAGWLAAGTGGILGVVHQAFPNAFLLANYAAGRHVYDGPCRNLDQCFWLDYRYPVRVSSLAPDIAAPLTFAAYRENRDPAMEAVLAREARRNSSARRR